MVCRLYICLSFHSVTNYGIHGKPAGAIESLLTDYLNRLWVLFLRATIQVMFLFSLVYHLRPTSSYKGVPIGAVRMVFAYPSWHINHATM